MNGQAVVENVLDILRGGINSALLGPGHASFQRADPDDMLVPPRFTRRLGAADESARRILNHGVSAAQEADTR